MPKPVNLRGDTWEFLRFHAGDLYSDDELRDQAARLLFDAGVMTRPDLLHKTIVSLPGDVEYRITSEAAQAISRNDSLIILRRLDGRETSVSRDVIAKALAGNCEFDQMERGD
jgi:hypothetical protein